MLQWVKGQAGQAILTLTELTTIANAYYLFYFVHVETKRVVAFVAGTDASSYPDRYNQFEIAAEFFENEPIGEWHYTIYEQEDGLNIDPANSVGVVEYGKLMLLSPTPFEYDIYNEKVNFKAYNG